MFPNNKQREREKAWRRRETPPPPWSFWSYQATATKRRSCHSPSAQWYDGTPSVDALSGVNYCFAMRCLTEKTRRLNPPRFQEGSLFLRPRFNYEINHDESVNWWSAVSLKSQSTAAFPPLHVAAGGPAAERRRRQLRAMRCVCRRFSLLLWDRDFDILRYLHPKGNGVVEEYGGSDVSLVGCALAVWMAAVVCAVVHEVRSECVAGLMCIWFWEEINGYLFMVNFWTSLSIFLDYKEKFTTAWQKHMHIYDTFLFDLVQFDLQFTNIFHFAFCVWKFLTSLLSLKTLVLVLYLHIKNINRTIFYQTVNQTISNRTNTILFKV